MYGVIEVMGGSIGWGGRGWGRSIRLSGELLAVGMYALGQPKYALEEKLKTTLAWQNKI